MTKKKFAYFVLAILIILGSPLAHATLEPLLTLSQYVSNGPVPPDVDDLSATIEFTVVGTELFVTVDNRTDENVSGNQYSISEIFFNTPDTLTDIPSGGNGQEAGDGLVLTGYSGGALGPWQKSTEFGYNIHHINGFGYFDMYILNGGQHVIDPGQTVTYTFDITGSETYTGTDFVYLNSPPVFGDYRFSGADPATSLQMVGGAKFVQGPGGESGFGAVPEPATILLLGIGSLVLMRRRKA